jgi:hypothetical protein
VIIPLAKYVITHGFVRVRVGVTMFCIFLEGIATRHEDILGSVSPLLFIDVVLPLVRYGHAVVCGGHTVRTFVSSWSPDGLKSATTMNAFLTELGDDF